MDDLWHMKTCQGLNRNSSQPCPLSASLNQFDMNSGQFGHPFLQQEVCVIERTIRQEPIGASLLNFGLQGPSLKSVKGDTGNSLLALVSGPQYQARSNYEPALTPRSTFAFSNPQAYQVGPISSPGSGRWPGHLTNVSAGNSVSGSGHGMDSSANMFGREVNLTMLGREVNLAQFSSIGTGQDCLDSNLVRTSGAEKLKQNVHDISNDLCGQSPFPQWLTEVISRQQRLQNVQSPTMFASGANLSRAAESSRDGSSSMSGIFPFNSGTTQGARVVCINYETGQRTGGELCLTQLGLLGVLCSCHGSHMSVAKFAQHVGIYSTNPGNVVMMDASGESLGQWRRTLFSQYGVKVPEDNQGWDWNEGEVCDNELTKCKAVVTQSWQKEVDVSYSGESLLKSRVTQVWDASLSPISPANFHSVQSPANLGLLSNIGEEAIQDSRESLSKSFGRAFRSNSVEFGSCPPVVKDLEESVRRSQGSAHIHSLRSPSQFGANPSAGFFNFISGSQQFVSGHAEQQVEEGQRAVGSRSFSKGLDVTWNGRREPLEHEKDNSMSSFELRLGQPSQQTQPVGAPISIALANRMQKVMQRVLDTGRQQTMQGSNLTSACGLHTLSEHLGPPNERPCGQQTFERTSHMEPNCYSTSPVDPSTGMEGSNSVLVDHPSFKRIEDVSTFRILEKLRERENMLSRDAGEFPTEGVRRWASTGSVERRFKSSDGLLTNSEHHSKRWANEAQHQIDSAVRSLSQGQQDLDIIVNQEWMPKSRPSEYQATESIGTLEGREVPADCGGKMPPSQGNCPPSPGETYGEDREQYAYGNMDPSRGTREGQGCACPNGGNSTCTISTGITFSKLGQQQDFCMKEGDIEGNQLERHRQRMDRDASQGPLTHDCSSPRVHRLRSFQAITCHVCSCGGADVDERPNQGLRVVPLAESAPAPMSVTEPDPVVGKRFSNQNGVVAKSGLRVASNGIFQWKEMGGVFVPGSETMVDAIHDDLLPPGARLEEDLLADTATKGNSAVAVSSGVSDKQQSVSDVCSKSSENVLSEFSDGTRAEEEVSNAQSVDKNPVESEVVDEGSEIGKCSSSDGVNMGLTPNLNMSSKDDILKHASPSSQGYPSCSNAEEGPMTKVGPRSRGVYIAKETTARHVEDDTFVETEKVEKKRTTKWKRLDAAIGTDCKRQKLSISPVNVTELFDAPQKLMEGSDISIYLGNKNLPEVSPSMCGKVGAGKARKILVTHGNRAVSCAEHRIGNNVPSPLDTDERYLKKTETLVIQVPLALNRTRAKRSGRPKSGKKKIAGTLQDDIRGKILASSETITLDPASPDSLTMKEPGATGSSLLESAALSTKSVPKRFQTLHVHPVKHGRVILGCPSPRNAARIVSINDIMNKPEVAAIAVCKDQSKGLVLKKKMNVSVVEDGSKASGIKEHLKPSVLKNDLKASTSKDGSEASLLKESLRASVVKESFKEASLKDGFQECSPKETLKISPKEVLKVKLFPLNGGVKVFSPKEGLKVSSTKDGRKGSFAKDEWEVSSIKDGPKRSFAKHASKMSSSKDDLRVSSSKDALRISFPKDGLKVSSAKNIVEAVSAKDSSKLSFAKEGSKLPNSKEGLKTSSLIASISKESSKPAPKSFVRLPYTGYGFKVAALKAGSKAASTKVCPKASVPRVDFQVPAYKDDVRSSAPKDGLTATIAKDHFKIPYHKDTWKASGLKNGLKVAFVKDRLKASASKDASHNTFLSDIGHASGCKNESNTYGLGSLIPMDSLKGPSNAEPEGKDARKLYLGVSIVAKSQDNQDKEPSLTSNKWKESRNVTKSHKQEVQKVRSIYELTAEKKLHVPGAGVSEFNDDDVKSSGVLKYDSCGRPAIHLESTVSVPVHFCHSQCLVPRGERSPRGNFSTMKTTFWQRYKAGSKGGSKLAIEPVEIVVGRSSGQDLRLSVGTPIPNKKVMCFDIKSQAATTPLRSPQNTKNVLESNDSTLAHVAQGMVVKDLFDEGLMDYSRTGLSKRIVEQPEAIGSTLKKQKLLGSSVLVEPRSGLNIQHLLPTSALATRTPTSRDLVGSEVKEDSKTKHQVGVYDLKISRRKKRCQKPKWIDCTVPEGVVDCCVCGSSVSELFNQIVRCSRCPVKVHQACYGVKKVPSSVWFCRTCKAAAKHPICVLCGYGGGAMTRAQKAKGFVQSLVKAWQDNTNLKKKDMCMPHSVNFHEKGLRLGHYSADHHSLTEKHKPYGCSIRENQEGKTGVDLSVFGSAVATHPSTIQKHEKPVPEENWTLSNTVTSGVADSTVVQWVHMVCALWMPGTKCLNFSTMGVFDVSGVAQIRRKLICSICARKGGACIQCRVVKCGIPFHAWCAHEKGLLQSEIVEDGSDQVGFYGKCLHHGKCGDLLNDSPDITDIVPEVSRLHIGTGTCARTEGYKGKLTLEQRAQYRRQATRNGSAAVSPEQVAAWLRINEKKTCKARRILKSANSDQKTDHREYLRFKQEQGWRRLSVYKSGIHALGLYTAEFIGRGEMVVEYIGEIVGLRVADKREADYYSGKRLQYQGACYLFRIDRERIIDATRKGGIARFVNHSCLPNCVAKVICVKNQSKVVFFAQRDIYAGEEITYDYQFNFEQEGDKIPCFCGSANCREKLLKVVDGTTSRPTST